MLRRNPALPPQPLPECSRSEKQLSESARPRPLLVQPDHAPRSAPSGLDGARPRPSRSGCTRVSEGIHQRTRMELISIVTATSVYAQVAVALDVFVEDSHLVGADSSGHRNSSGPISSIGFAKRRRLRGRSLSSVATQSRSSALWTERSVPFGKYWRNSPLVFSLVARCQGACGSQK